MWPFKKKVTASEAGKLGNMVKRDRARLLVRRRCDKMRAAKGMPEARWPE